MSRNFFFGVLQNFSNRCVCHEVNKAGNRCLSAESKAFSTYDGFVAMGTTVSQGVTLLRGDHGFPHLLSQCLKSGMNTFY